MLFSVSVVGENSDNKPDCPENAAHLVQAQHEDPDDQVDHKPKNSQQRQFYIPFFSLDAYRQWRPEWSIEFGSFVSQLDKRQIRQHKSDQRPVIVQIS